MAHRSRFSSLLLLLVGCTSAAHGQSAMAYRSGPDTVYVEVLNPHLMYFVMGEDTIGTPVQAVTLEAQRWTRAGSHLEVVVRQESLLPQASIKSDTFQIANNGRVTSINSRAPGLHGRIDFLPRWPQHALGAGSTWSDTLEIRTEGPAGEHIYAIQREYRVVRMLDTLGTRVMEIEAEAAVRYRDGWWADSTQRAYAWIDVSGPMRERLGFDASRGQVVYRSWWMNLAGQGGIPDGSGGMRELPAGLISGSRHRIISAREAAELRENPSAALPSNS